MKCSDEPEKFAGERIQDGDRGGREGEGAERPETGLVGGGTISALGWRKRGSDRNDWQSSCNQRHYTSQTFHDTTVT